MPEHIIGLSCNPPSLLSVDSVLSKVPWRPCVESDTIWVSSFIVGWRSEAQRPLGGAGLGEVDAVGRE